jgi:hypothetical protein
MTLTVLALSAQSLPLIQDRIQSALGASVILEGPIPAFTYLLVPFILMVFLGVRSTRKRSKSSGDRPAVESDAEPIELKL